jgi:hypothetical protein
MEMKLVILSENLVQPTAYNLKAENEDSKVERHLRTWRGEGHMAARIATSHFDVQVGDVIQFETLHTCLFRGHNELLVRRVVALPEAPPQFRCQNTTTSLGFLHMEEIEGYVIVPDILHFEVVTY